MVPVCGLGKAQLDVMLACLLGNVLMEAMLAYEPGKAQTEAMLVTKEMSSCGRGEA